MPNRFALNGAWQFRDARASTWSPATVPGCVHTDLLAASHIPDPFYRDNERHLQWIGEKDWVYRRTFTLDTDWVNQPRLLLCCEGLDTLATVFLNGKCLGTTDNMFRPWRFPVHDLVRTGENILEIHFASPLPYIAEKQKTRDMPDWRGAYEPAGRAWLRKQPCNFGWDWGPVLITCGIWQDIYLEAHGEACLDDVYLRQLHHGEEVNLHLTGTITRFADAPLMARVAVTFAGETLLTREAPIHGADTPQHMRFILPIPDPQRWWPNGLGAQPLYTVTLTLYDASDTVLDTWEKRIGLRTVRLIRTPEDGGESFGFVVNEIPVFIKGANWIPTDTFVNRVTPATYRARLESAQAVHMNMLRVWGGGIYENDVFYELCDELGLLVWQDFMFASSAYPTFDPDFLASVREEAEFQIQRLRHHACLALWCGNNELEPAFVGRKWSKWTMSQQDYDRLFNRLLPDLVAEHDPDRTYWPASPHTPAGFEENAAGDAHLWHVWHGKEPFETYRKSTHRFVSEFGFQSFPDLQTIAAFTASEDRHLDSEVLHLHQRSTPGNALILHYLEEWFPLPKTFDDQVLVSQILQGIALQMAIEHFRQNQPHCSGTLYWQLNDCWPAASWSSLDYSGRWKALHYFAQRFYAPLLVTGQINDKGVALFGINEDRALQEGMLYWQHFSTAGAIINQGEIACNLAPQSSTSLAELPLKNPDPNTLLHLRLQTKNQTTKNLVWLARPKAMTFYQPTLDLKITALSETHFELICTTQDIPAFWIHLATDAVMAGHFSDNFFSLGPHESHTVTWTTAAPIKTETLKTHLQLRSLWDIL